MEVEPPRVETPYEVRRQKNLNNCPKCKGISDDKPCIEWAEVLRSEFTIYIDSMFHRKMKAFTDFIEESLDVDD